MQNPTRPLFQVGDLITYQTVPFGNSKINEYTVIVTEVFPDRVKVRHTLEEYDDIEFVWALVESLHEHFENGTAWLVKQEPEWEI